MCMVLYVAAASPLRELPESTPLAPLSARPINGDEEAVRAHFSVPHVYFLGSHTGCSCGFQYGPYVQDDADGRESVRRLGMYLTEAVRQFGTLEIYACWDGHEANAIESRDVVTTGHFTGDADEFDLEEGWFATVLSPAT